MKDEELFSALRDHVRDERKDDAAIERALRGETADLDPVLAAAAKPLGEEAVDRIAARVGASHTLRTVPLRRRITVAAVPLALAAAMLLAVGVGSRGGPELPGYAVTATGEQTMRGESAPSSTLRLGTAEEARFTVVARPQHPVGARVTGYAFAVRAGVVGPLDADVQVSEEGSVRVTGQALALDGASELRIVVGAPDADAALARARTQKSDARVLVLSVAIAR